MQREDIQANILFFCNLIFWIYFEGGFSEYEENGIISGWTKNKERISKMISSLFCNLIFWICQYNNDFN